MIRSILVSVAAAILVLSALGADEKKEDESFVKVDVKGTLQTGIAAIGGETTGIIIKTKDGTLELDLGKNQDLRDQANKLNGKAVLVTGNLTVKKGVEIRQRLIVKVATLKAAGGEDK